jgi:hypothetical protein
MHPVLRGGTFGMMSAEKPSFPASIESSHENLVSTLKAMGLRHDQTHGLNGTDPERSVIIHNPREDQMKTLGKLFGQESVIYSTKGQHKLMYTNGPHEGKFRGTVMGEQPHAWFENPPTSHYTHIPGNGHVRMNFDHAQEPQGGNANIKIAKSLKFLREQALKKALPPGAKLDVKNPGDQTANIDNRKGFLSQATPQERAVGEDAIGGGGAKVSTGAPTPMHQNVTNGMWAEAIPLAGRQVKVNRARGWGDNHPQETGLTSTMDSWSGSPGYDEALQADPYGTTGGLNHLDNIESALTTDEQFWGHPNFYEWHDGHTDHHNPKPWDKQQAMDTARSLGLIKSYATYASPFGQVMPGTNPNLGHYDYTGKLQAVQDLVRKHGYKVGFIGGKYGKPDHANQNYNTGHLQIADPSNGGQIADPSMQDNHNAWRQLHELSHALTHHELNNVYGEGKRVGPLGHQRTLNEAQRAVHWEHLAAHKQRDLNRQIGIHVPEETFNKEYNTIMHDAVHRAVHGQASNPSAEGFTPHAHQVPLSQALDMVRGEGKKLGLQGAHDTVQKPAQPMLVKALPKGAKLDVKKPGDQTANLDSQSGFMNQPVAQDHYMAGTGAVPAPHSPAIPNPIKWSGDSPADVQNSTPAQRQARQDVVTRIHEAQGANSGSGSGLIHDTAHAHTIGGQLVHQPDGKTWVNRAHVNVPNPSRMSEDWYWQNVDREPPANTTVGVPTPDKDAFKRSPLFKRKKSQ